MALAMKKNNLRAIYFGFCVSLAGMAQGAGIEITDKVLGIGQGEFTVERHAKINIGKADEYYVYVDILKLSAWDGSVLDRCRFEVKRAQKSGGDWKTDVLKHDPECKGAKSNMQILEPEGTLEMKNDALIMGRRQLATEEFLRERMQAMVKAEKTVCQENPDQKLLAGCNLIADDEEISIAGKPLANEDHVLVPVEIGKYGKPDDEAAALWVAIGRKYWRP